MSVTLTDGSNTIISTATQWLTNLITPQNIDETIGGKVLRQIGDSRIRIAFSTFLIDPNNAEADFITLKAIFDSNVEYLTLTLDRNPKTTSTNVLYCVFSSGINILQNANETVVSFSLDEVIHL